MLTGGHLRQADGLRIIIFTEVFRNEGSSPGWRFTGPEWILLEIHRAGMDFTGDSPGWNECKAVTVWFNPLNIYFLLRLL
jgi:hypothetical protein